jgi:hypothetical protein
MKYYRTAVLMSWLIVGGFLTVLLMTRGGPGAYQAIPFYLAFAMVGGTVPAVVCAWVLREMGRVTGSNWLLLWMLRGGYLGLAYAMMSRFMMKSVIGHVSIESIKGFFSLVLFGPSLLLESGLTGIAIIILTGIINGAVLHNLNQED